MPKLNTPLNNLYNIPDSARFTTVKKLIKPYQWRIIDILCALFFHPVGARKYACNKSSKSVTLVFYRISIIMRFSESGHT